MSRHIVRLVNSDIIMHLPFGFISCLFSPESPLRDKLYEAKLKFMPEHKHNSDSVKSVRTKMPKSERDTSKGIFFAHQKFDFYLSFGPIFSLVRELSVQGKKIAFTTTLMLILLSCVICGRILMSENVVNLIICGPLNEQLKQH